MWDVQTAHRWGSNPHCLALLRRWSWCRVEWPRCIVELAAAEGFAASAVPVPQALAHAFWRWASALDQQSHFEALDPLDFAHHASGLLLVGLLNERPLRQPWAQRSGEVRVMTRTAMTLLAAWRQALGAPALANAGPWQDSAHWASYLENIQEDPGVAVAFLDLFAGLEPEWRFPLMLLERPAFRRRLAEQRPAPGDVLTPAAFTQRP